LRRCGVILFAVGEKRGQLDALLDVGLILGGRSQAPTEDRSNAAPNARGSVPDELAPGRQLGKYQLERLLGSGGMGAVWEARDTELDRRIALKILRAIAGLDATARGRVVREARAMARLGHPNVVTLFDGSGDEFHA